MANYPSNPIPSVGSRESYIIPIIKTETEGNYLRVRRRSTKKRETFELKYNQMSYSDYDTIKEFFTDYQGSAFTWTHPITGVDHTVVFDMNELQRTMYETHCEVTIMLAEL